MYNLSKFFHRECAFQKPKNLLSEDEWPDEWKTIFYKIYKRANRIHLSKPEMPPDVLFEDVLRKRESADKFERGSLLSISKLSSLLYYSCGLINQENPQRSTKRPYPSAGGQYPLETYVAISSSADILRGIYHYCVPTHELELIRPASFVEEIQKAFFFDWIKNASVFLIISIVFDRTLNKYEERGYRYVLEEVGAMTQNIYLVGAALGLRVLTTAGVEDETINEILDFDGVEESATAFIAIGN